MRTVIYARYSTDRQGETSIEGQAAVCREVAAREGWTIVHAFDDRAMSGADPRRPGYLALLDAGRAGRYDLILVEEVSRLWRSQGEQWRCVEELESLGLHVVGARDGVDTRRDGFELLLAVQGAMNARARKEAAWRTHRGQSTAVTNGDHPGGIAYGYRTVVTGHNARGEPLGYRLEIHPDRAHWVRHIHERYADGASVRQIVHELNAMAVPSPRGSSWAVSALVGSPKKGTGILNNELYAGRYIWNRSRFIKDARTGKRRRIERTMAEWRIVDREDLRIVTADIWLAVRARLGRPGRDDGGRGEGRRPSTLFGGLLRCGICGGAMVAVNKYDYGCAAHKDRGPTVCKGLRVKRRDADARLLSTVRDELLDPAAIAELQAEVRRLQREQSAPDPARRIEALDREIRNLTDAIATAGLSPALHDRLRKSQTERDALTRAKAATPATVMIDVLGEYRALLANLQGALQTDVTAARAALREVMGVVTVKPEGNELWAEIEHHAGLLNLAAGAVISNVVAGDRFRHWNRRVRLK